MTENPECFIWPAVSKQALRFLLAIVSLTRRAIVFVVDPSAAAAFSITNNSIDDTAGLSEL